MEIEDNLAISLMSSTGELSHKSNIIPQVKDLRQVKGMAEAGCWICGQKE